AQCTPDFFGFNKQDELQYRGQLDASRTTLVPNARRDLFEAMKQVAETGHGPANQTPARSSGRIEGRRLPRIPHGQNSHRVYWAIVIGRD
ncbi:MAG: hypothetical protein WCF38_20390, partial [Pseudolabrys sp.]